MRPVDRIITELPLKELFDERGPVKAVRQRDLSAEDIRDLMRAGAVQFVVANCGSKPIWVTPNEQYAFWKREVLPRLANPAESVELDKFPDSLCYFASEWRRQDGTAVVLLEVAH